jgi:hypothetical protein
MPFTALASKLKQAGLGSIRSEHYEGGHWLGTFAVYLVSGRNDRRHEESVTEPRP